ncbi:MAG: aminotransferase class IV [Phycisphaerae bacterium]|nr:aminotransferase class IV [Phycisphaerae bacterium]
MKELAFVNGVFVPIEKAVVSVEDRGFQFGDSVYEVVVAYDGRPFLIEPHLQRLRRSCDAIGLNYPFHKRPLEPIIAEGIARRGEGDTLVYIQLTRGVAPRAHGIPQGLEPTLVMTFRPLKPVPEELRRRGMRLKAVRDERWARCFIKAVTLLPNVLAKDQALREGYDDAVFISPSGEVRECTAANIFMVRDSTLFMPTRDVSVLHGITQQFIMECAEAIAVPVREERFPASDLFRADELFLSSTTLQVLGATSVDGKPVGDGKVGPVTLRLHEAFRERSRAQSRKLGA